MARHSFLMKFSNNVLINYINQSESYNQLFDLLEHSKNRRSIQYVIEYCSAHEIDISTLVEKHKNYIKDLRSKKRFTSTKYLIENKKCHGQFLKNKIIEDNLMEDKCSECGLLPIWQNESITLQLDHINGIHDDNRLENLRILCPNCHSQTSNFAGKNIDKKKSVFVNKTRIKKECKVCKDFTYTRQKTCSIKCGGVFRKKIVWLPVIELIKLVEELGYRELGRRIGVSDNAIRKHIKKHG